MSDSKRLHQDRAMILVIDVQDKLLPLIDGYDAVLQSAGLLLRGGMIFKLPVLATEQYPKGIGHTEAGLAGLLRESGAEVLEKMTFSCCADAAITDRLKSMNRPQVLVTGIEAHVCVQQTSLDLRAMGYEVTVCADAIGSRTRIDYFTALQRLRQAGVVLTTVESALFELCVACGTPDFKEMIEVIKEPRVTDPRFATNVFDVNMK